MISMDIILIGIAFGFLFATFIWLMSWALVMLVNWWVKALWK